MAVKKYHFAQDIIDKGFCFVGEDSGNLIDRYIREKWIGIYVRSGISKGEGTPAITGGYNFLYTLAVSTCLEDKKFLKDNDLPESLRLANLKDIKRIHNQGKLGGIKVCVGALLTDKRSQYYHLSNNLMYELLTNEGSGLRILKIKTARLLAHNTQKEKAQKLKKRCF
jgi:hypothetical protein